MFDYTSLTPDQVSTGIEEAISRAEGLLDAVVAIEGDRTFDNTLLPLDEIGDVLGQANARYGFMAYVHPDESVRAPALAGQEALQSFGVQLTFREDLYEAVKEYASSAEARQLDGERARFLEHTMRDLRRAGHELDQASRDQLRERAQRLVELQVKFQSNIDNDDNKLLVDPDDLEGLPESYIEGLETDDDSKKLVVSMEYPDVTPFMENAERRDLRQELSYLFNTRAVEENRPILEEAVRLRDESARLLGYSSWAHYVLEERMAAAPERVNEFYEDLLPGLTKKGQEEIAAIAKLLREDTGEDTVRTWDWRFYDTKQRQTDYGVDSFEVAGYLPMDQVIEGMFVLCEETFGLRFKKENDAQAWHPDVTLYSIRDRSTDETLSYFYLDLFPRKGKFSHAAEFPMVPSRRLRDGSYQNPVCAMVANFTKPTQDKPSLIKHSELETLFHEFGHVLHQNLGRTELGRFSGTNVERDFVEAPSQIMQHWVWRADILRRFAKHHDTGEPIPDELVEKLVEARKLNKGIHQLRQAEFGILDQRLHAGGDSPDLDRMVRETAEISGFPFHEGTFFLASFGHLLGGYDASYYGYMWSEVYGDDMFTLFEEQGVTNPEIGLRYRQEVLEKGGTVDADEMLVSFLGREPDNSAFLRKLGVAGTESGIPVV